MIHHHAIINYALWLRTSNDRTFEYVSSIYCDERTKAKKTVCNDTNELKAFFFELELYCSDCLFDTFKVEKFLIITSRTRTAYTTTRGLLHYECPQALLAQKIDEWVLL